MKIFKDIPKFSIIVLAMIIFGCICANLLSDYNPSYMNLTMVNQAPNSNHIFGTDNMGRDIFSMIWYGGRVSLFIGITATIISTVVAVVYGCISGLAYKTLDTAMMRITEIFLTLPTILIIIFVQGIIGNPSKLSLAVIIGLTSWMSVAKVVRTEVKQIRNSDYILSAKLMGGSFLYILRRHLLPNVWPAILFMVVMNMAYAIGTEATLSFLGLGLPIEIVSWGSMMSLSEGALLSGYWWIILIPGLFMVITLICVNNIANYLKQRGSREYSNL